MAECYLTKQLTLRLNMQQITSVENIIWYVISTIWLIKHFIVQFTCGSCCLTPQEGFTLLISRSIRVTLLGGSSSVSFCNGHDGSPTPHQKLTKRTVITRGCTMKRSPVGHIKSFNYVVFIDMDISVHRLPVPGLWIPGYNIILKNKTSIPLQLLQINFIKW